ncbi:hypothetical protein BP5796_04349 [Coleophoma crateriformis]|uniref:Uncharacterized protein n=1 Tax=Coleophoma crateriformis TaxID=565419 RepID=A0A3D8SIL5_9HELO|nr:hypothetical protein BP5796_04349 [Coleophoma crateriformis]
MEPIAIVGSACHFAGDVNSPSKLWELLREPRDVRSTIPESRFSAEGFYHPDGSYHGHSNVKHSYLVNEDLSTFDAEFFGIKPVEAKAMDPQQRLLLETVYEGLESAGMTIEGLRGSDTSVYVGVMCADYEAMVLRDLQSIPTYFATGVGRSIISNRISYFFDWHGPSMTIDTACSSSLVAINSAIQTLRAGISRTALAAGTNLILGPENFVVESKLKMLSPDGLGRMWDAGANGYARGDGVAVVVLKTLSAALKDGDHIDCIIRESGVNQDGATTGITMPSASAQQNLVVSTYARAGLNPLLPEDRCQYFEAHGTGTPAGDPIEAEAIQNAFFGGQKDRDQVTPLYVGSIKTVLGHTEGTAGVAAILKASLALQYATLPPNLLFENLSPSVARFYKNLELVQTAKSWPEVPNGQPRRASVNSFGFGGTNGHAILESYDNTATSSLGEPADVAVFAPFVFSASSEQSLLASLSAYATHLENNPSINPRDLAWTLRSRRSLLPYRTSFTAGSIEALRTGILAKLQETERSIVIRTLSSSKRDGNLKLLGVFTGQGAQYARMGAQLLEKSSFARKVVQELEASLARLPEKDRPVWSLEAEILADATMSRVHVAAISQPLCTAVQIVLVDLLRLAHVNLAVVVGHSSGEIGAAYAAGYLTARDAICIAYYRGLHCGLACSPTHKNIRGAMLAVGTSIEDATMLCKMDEFLGRINVAACNSPSSVTISGDEDAIEELQVVLDDEKKFNRRLKVDMAYHSKHMIPCFDPYVESIRRCGVKARKPSGHCTWISSVYERPIDSEFGLSDVYWAENMSKPVLFSQALSRAVSAIKPDLVLEIGPHPALKGPAIQTIQEVLNQEVPYQGVLARGTNAVEAFSTGLGFLWSHLDSAFVNLDTYEKTMTGIDCFKVVKNLPTYQWNHGVKYWHESRMARKARHRPSPVHPLLGDVSPDSAPHHLSWRHLLRASEIDWLDGHQVQNQIVYPAAGYTSAALEASKSLAEGREIRLIEIRDFFIHQAIAFDEEDAGIEVLIELSGVTRDLSTESSRAKWTYSAALGAEADEMTLAASGEVEVFFEEASLTVLPERGSPPTHLVEVEVDRWYSFLAELGYIFSGRFRSLTSLRRKYGKSSGFVQMQPPKAGEESLLSHPAELDAAYQSLILAYTYPGDDQLRSLHLPTSIKKIRVNPALCNSKRSNVELYPVDSTLAPTGEEGLGFTGDINIYTNDCLNAAIQVQGIRLVPLGGSATADDRNVFSKMDWVNSSPDGEEAAKDIHITQHEHDHFEVLERISTYYLRHFDQIVPMDDPYRIERPHSCYLDYARHMTALVETGKHPNAKKEWLNDTLEDIMKVSEKFAETLDVRIMHLVGQTMPKVFKRETTMLENFRGSNILDDYYANGFGLRQSSKWLGQTVKQITDRYPHLNILEIGAGTGGATKSVLGAIGKSFLTYTFTDVSSGFFENGAAVFSKHKDQMIFKTLDAERDPMPQGYAEESYDLIIASFIIHATAKLENTMRNLRKLLRPGGFLVVGEGTFGNSAGGFIFGPLPGWWLGVDEGRVLTPFVSLPKWDEILKATGFSGIDTKPPSDFEDVLAVSLFVSQAVDEKIKFLREPLSEQLSTRDPIEKLVLVGGKSQRVARLIWELKTTLERFAARILVYETLEDVDYTLVNAESTVICLTELDKPVFQDITESLFHSFKTMIGEAKTILWITSGRREDEPFSNMTVGFGRTAVHETTELRLQFLDIEDPGRIEPRIIAETLLRLHTTSFRSTENNQDNLLWMVEPEIVIDDKGRLLVPRLGAMTAANDRYNSARRSITREVDVKECAVAIRKDGSRSIIEELSRYDTRDNTEPVINLRTTYATSSALKTPLGHQFLILGVDLSTESKYLALVPSLASVLKVPKSSTAPVKSSSCSDAEYVALLAAHLVSIAILDHLFAGQTLVVHNPSRLIAQAITAQASLKQVEVVYTTDSVDTGTPISGIQLPLYLSQYELKKLLPKNISSFVGFSNDNTQISKNELTIISSLSDHCRKETTKTLYSSDGYDIVSSSAAILGQTLQKAIGHVKLTQGDSVQGIESISLEDVATGEYPQNPMAIIDWEVPTSLPVQVARLDTRPIFKGNKTYWMVGLSGNLGISLVDWMIRQGARYIVLTSRNPSIEPAWVEDHQRNGTTVKIFPCDVTDEAGLKHVYNSICATLPPIIGAINGAMVLNDIGIRNMTFKQLNTVVRPKVYGSIHLDRIFRDLDLDFFILLSSINCVIGNLGQANYAAANTFMCALAANRRKRGLTASAVNIGAIIGAGYITRESNKAVDATVKNMALMHLSEEDFHQLFAEAIEAGHVDSLDGPEISTGLLEIAVNSTHVPRWFSDPKFARFLVHPLGSDEDNKERPSAGSIRELLQSCQNQEDVGKIVKRTFAAQLRNILQMTMADDDLMEMRSNDIGLDSLVSVDIRTWFLKNYQVSIPVLKIMGNDTMGNLAQHALENVPAELVPHISVDGDGKTDKDTSSSTGSESPTKVGTSADTSAALSTAPTTPERSGSLTDLARHKQEIMGEIIDWDAESCPPEDIVKISPTIPMLPETRPNSVLLTGVSGLLGHHLLNYLLEKTSVKKIICVAVRQLSERLKAKELPQNNRVVYYEGDLRQPQLGLSEQDVATIFEEIEVVIHNGADTSHLKFYQAVRESNVLSTKFLVRYCVPRKIPVHYVSSVGVALFLNKPTFPEASATSVYPPPDGSHGYISGKWVSERMLERSNEMYDLPVWIHRPSTIIREGDDATTAKAQLDWVNALMYYCRELKAVPKVEHIRGAMDLVYVQNVCADIIGHVLNNKPRTAHGASYVHEVGDIVIPLDQLQDIGTQQGKSGRATPFKILSMAEWTNMAVAAGLHPAVAALIQTMDSPGVPDYPSLLKSST